mgnify:CR=1 FL=1
MLSKALCAMCGNGAPNGPSLYDCILTLRADGDKQQTVVAHKVGFRRIEIKNARLLVKWCTHLYQKGVNRHEHNDTLGHVQTREIIMNDLRLIKQLNMNAIRTSHYPNHPLFYQLCDQYGIYVVDEANIETHGMVPMNRLTDDPRWLPAMSERVTRMVQRDRNHPSVIIWSLGNESGHGANHDALYRWIKSVDPSRPVQYEGGGADTSATDIICPMYARVDEDQPFPAVPKFGPSKKLAFAAWRNAPADPLRICPRDG